MESTFTNSTFRSQAFGLVQRLVEAQQGLSWAYDKGTILWIGIIVLSVTHVLMLLNQMVFRVKAPFVGFRSLFEPAWLVGLRFAFHSKPMVQEGYDKYNKEGRMFKVRRNDTEILVIPNKYIHELRDMAEDKVSAMKAHIKNIVGKYTIGDLRLVLTSDLHRRTLSQKLTPALGNLIPSLKDELDFTLKEEVAECTSWTPVQVNDLIVRIVARISARVFVGSDLCRNNEWLYISIHFTKNLGQTRNLLRLVPGPLRGIVAMFLPSYWRIHQNVRTAQRLLGPVIMQRRFAKNHELDWEEPNDFLQWMMNNARANEGHPDDLAHRQLLVSLAAIHTTSMQVTHFIYDLCTHPEYIEDLRAEIISVLRQDVGFKKTSLNKMRKLDSFLKESQRINSPYTLAFQRVVEKPLTMKDGTHFPKGTHIAMAADAIVHDAELLPGGGDPFTFEPFRFCKLRKDPSNPDAINKHQFATTDSNTLHFGYGKFACPGRFFASNEIKLILSHILMMYEFEWAEGASRPPNLNFEEASYPNPTGKVIMRRRRISERDIAEIIGEV